MNLKETLEYMTEDAQSSNTQITTKAQAGSNANAEQYKQLVATFEDRVNDIKKLYQIAESLKKVLSNKNTKNQINQTNKQNQAEVKNQQKNQNLNDTLNMALQGKELQGNTLDINSILQQIEICEKNFKTVTQIFENEKGFKNALESYINGNSESKNNSQQQNNKNSKALEVVQNKKDQNNSQQNQNQNQTQQSETTNQGQNQKPTA